MFPSLVGDLVDVLSTDAVDLRLYHRRADVGGAAVGVLDHDDLVDGE